MQQAPRGVHDVGVHVVSSPTKLKPRPAHWAKSSTTQPAVITPQHAPRHWPGWQVVEPTRRPLAALHWASETNRQPEVGTQHGCGHGLGVQVWLPEMLSHEVCSVREQMPGSRKEQQATSWFGQSPGVQELATVLNCPSQGKYELSK
jgi:hypothetical protein